MEVRSQFYIELWINVSTVILYRQYLLQLSN